MATDHAVTASLATTTSIRQNLQSLLASGASIGAVLGPLVGLLIWTLPLGLDPIVQHTVAIVGFMLVYWITEAFDHGMTALLGCFLFWVLQVVPPAVAFGGFTKPTPWFIFGMLLIGQATSHAGLAKRIGKYVLHAVGSSYSRLLLGIITLVYAMNLLIPSPTAQIATLAPLVIGVGAALGLEPHSNVSRGLFILLTYASSIFSKFFLSNSIAILSHGIMVEQTGVDVLWSQWFVAFIPLALPTIVAFWLTIRWLFPPEHVVFSPDQFVPQDTAYIREPWNREEKKVLSWLLLGIALWATDFLHHVSPAAIGIGLGLVLTLPKVGVLDAKAVKSISFPLVLFAGGVVSMAIVLTETGTLNAVVAPLQSWLVPLLSQAFSASLALYWGGFLYHLIVGSEFTMSSSFLPVLLHIATSHGYNASAIGMLWTFAGGGKLFVYQNTAFLLAYSYGVFTAKDLLKVGAVMTVVEGLFIMVLVPLYWPLVGLSWPTEPAEQRVVSVQAEAAPGGTTDSSTAEEGESNHSITSSAALVSSMVVTPLSSEGLDAETTAWASIRDSTVPSDFVEFLTAFPQNRFTFAARMRLRQLLQE